MKGNVNSSSPDKIAILHRLLILITCWIDPLASLIALILLKSLNNLTTVSGSILTPHLDGTL